MSNAQAPSPRASLRMTRQRQVILEELHRAPGHPTADELYARVRRRLPPTSLGTVYRNLEILSELGIVRKVELGGAQRRWDSRAEQHYHVRCVSCGRVDDVQVKPLPGVQGALRPVTECELLGHRLEFLGRCPRCRHEAATPQRRVRGTRAKEDTHGA